ncbi:unnamed protein product, partial [Strongylus vulgaris]
MSGSPWASWALGSNVVKSSLDLAKVLNCDRNIRGCLSKKSPDEIYDAIQKVRSYGIGATDSLVPLDHNARKHLQDYYWFFISGGRAADMSAWLLCHPYDLTFTAPRKTAMIGLTNKEAALFTIMGVAPFMQKFSVNPTTYTDWNREKLINKLKKLVELDYSGTDMQNIIDEIIAYYVDRGEERNYEFYIDRYTQFISDTLFTVSLVDGAITRRNTGWDIYAYVLDHHNEAVWNDRVPKRLRGAAHASEFPYINGVYLLGEFKFDENDQVIADIFQQSIIEFVKNGAPKNQHVVWQDAGKDTKLRYLRIAPNPEMKSGFNNETVDFWHKLRKYAFDLIEMMPTKDSNT